MLNISKIKCHEWNLISFESLLFLQFYDVVQNLIANSLININMTKFKYLDFVIFQATHILTIIPNCKFLKTIQSLQRHTKLENSFNIVINYSAQWDDSKTSIYWKTEKKNNSFIFHILLTNLTSEHSICFLWKWVEIIIISSLSIYF